MDLAQALTYVFEDRQWGKKLIPLALFSLLSIIPVFGLLAIAIALGFMMQTAANVREGLPRPLPIWNDYPVKFNIGANVLGAIITAHLPVIIIGGCSTWLLSALGSGFLGNSVLLLAVCCTFPLMLIYVGFAWALLGAGVAEYIETGESRRLYRLSHLWDVVLTHRKLAFQWVLYNFLVTFVGVALLAVPCLGWAVTLILIYPVYGHLLGQFAQKLAVTNKPRAKVRPSGAL